MGCGASKAAQVVEADITIRDYPTRRSHESSPVRSPHSADTVGDHGGGEGEGVSLLPSDQSVIERAAQAGIRAGHKSHSETPPSRPGEERTHDQATATGALAQESSADSLPQFVAFEVCMSPDGETAPKAPVPRRLAKLDGPQLTAEMLAEKQKEARERRHKELEKKASRRLSKKDRLMREIMAARELEQQMDREPSSGSVDSASRHEARNEGGRKAHVSAFGEEEGTSYDPSAEFEVDSTFNTDQDQNLEFWGNSNHESVAAPLTHHQGDSQELTKSRTGDDDDDLFFDHGDQSNLLDSNSHISEQYM